MSTLITILHVTVCLFLMLTVLLQQGKGGMGGAFGGANTGSVFGGAGASSFLRRLTAAAATIFMLTSMVLAYMASRDAGEPLERYSKAEAARLKQKKQAEKKGLEGAADAGVGDGGAAPLSLDPAGGATPDPTAGSAAPDPAAGSAAPTAPVTPGATTPVEAPAAGSAAPAAGSAAPAATPPAATPPAATPPAATPPAATPPAAPAPATPGAGSASR